MAAETAVVKAKKARAPPAHPPFVDMITEAIVALKERTGSSQYAITKYVEEKHKQLPQSFKKLLLLNLKKLVASGKLVKVKASFKLPPRTSSTAAAAAPAKTKPEAAKAKKSTAKTTAAAAAVKPKAKGRFLPKLPKAVAAKPKATAAVTKRKAPKVVAAKPKAKAVAKPAAKAAKTASRTSPGKKVEAKAVKKPAATKAVKKPKSVKSPAKKKFQPKRGKK